MKKILLIILLLFSVCHGAIDFEADNTDYLYKSTAMITAYPFTISCWFRSEGITTNQNLMWVGDHDVADHFCYIAARGDLTGDPIIAFSHHYGGGTNAYAKTSSGYSANTWHHACGVWDAVDDRRVYIDGGSKGTDTQAVDPMADHDSTSIGYAYDSSPGSPFDGMLAECAIWNASLTDTEVAILAKAYSPLSVRPTNLVSYTPLIRGYEDLVHGTTWSEGAAPEGPVAHCRVIYPGSSIYLYRLGTVTFLEKGTIFLYTAANWDSPTIYFEAYLRASAGTVYVDLYDITSSAAVTDSELSETSATFTRNRSVALTLTDGHEYRARVGRKSGASTGEYLGAKLIFME